MASRNCARPRRPTWRNRAPGLQLGEGDVQRLLHELQVHQIEPEMQNESLHQAQIAFEKAHDRYFDLYGFAPSVTSPSPLRA